MRVLILSVLFFAAFAVVSCEKCDEKEYKCTFDETIVLKDGQKKIAELEADPMVKKYILSDLVKDPDCNYYVDGKVKYVLKDKEALIVDYGHGKLGNWALLTSYSHEWDDAKPEPYPYHEDECGVVGRDKDDWGSKGCDKEDWDKEMDCFKFEQVCKKDPINTNTASVADRVALPASNTARSN